MVLESQLRTSAAFGASSSSGFECASALLQAIDFRLEDFALSWNRVCHVACHLLRLGDEDGHYEQVEDFKDHEEELLDPVDYACVLCSSNHCDETLILNYNLLINSNYQFWPIGTFQIFTLKSFLAIVTIYTSSFLASYISSNYCTWSDCASVILRMDLKCST